MRRPSRQTGQRIRRVFVSLTVLFLTNFSHMIMALGSFELRLVKLVFPKQSMCRCDATNLKVRVCLSHHLLPPPKDPACTLGEAVRYGWSPHSHTVQIPFSYTWSGRFTLSVRVACQCNTTDVLTETLISQMVLAHSLKPSDTWTRISTTSQPVESIITDVNVAVPLFVGNGTKITEPDRTEQFNKNNGDHQILANIHPGGNGIDLMDSSRLGMRGFGIDSDDRIQIPKDRDKLSSVIKLIKAGPRLRGNNVLKKSSHDSNQIAAKINVNNKESGTYLESKEHSNETFLTHRIGSMTVLVRVTCQEFYHGTGCILYCKPRNDFVGHFRCTHDGSKVCLPGWRGTSCREAICHSRCLPSRGRCVEPFKCECVPGWRGKHCEQCQTSNGCQHGFCHRPDQCVCNKDWTGPNCDKEIDYELMLCQNGGTRTQGKTCLCAPGFTGIYCEFTLCPENICQNNGTCLLRHNGPFCKCPSEFGGPLCQRRVDGTNSSNHTDGHYPCANSKCDNDPTSVVNPCNSFTCFNSGSCKFDGITQIPYCECLPFFSGHHCENFMNPCDKNPCRNGGKCQVDHVNHFEDVEGPRSFGISQHQNRNGSLPTVKCECPRKFTGEMCDIRRIKHRGKKRCGRKCMKNKLTTHVEDICSGNHVCLNGGRCVRAIREESYRCQCYGRWTGEFCEIDDTDPCASQVCLNGGQCRVKSGVPQCVCPSNFDGYYCENPVKLCSPRTCHYGGICIEHRQQFFCVCRRNYFGKFCERTWWFKPIKLHITHSRSEACKLFSSSAVILYWSFLVLILSIDYI